MELLIKLIQLVYVIGLASGQLYMFNKDKTSYDKSMNIGNGIYPHDTNLEMSLLDVEPEANLFLDEVSIQSSTSYQLDNNFIEDTKEIDLKKSDLLDIRHLALVHPGTTALVKANYGPFIIKKLIDPFETLKNISKPFTEPLLNSNNNNNNNNNNKLAKKLKLKQKFNKIISEQITAYLITKEIRRTNPMLKVLFYSNHLNDFKTNVINNGINDRLGTMCAAIIVQHHGERLLGTCSPSNSKQNACLAKITLPALFWPPLDVTNNGVDAAKQQKSTLAKVYYTMVHIDQGQICNDHIFKPFLEHFFSMDSEQLLLKNDPPTNLIFLSDVLLTPFRGSYEEVTNDNVVTILIPQEPVYPNSKMYIPVKYTYNPDYPVSSFSLKVQVKPGLKILGAQLSHPDKLWKLKVDLKPKQNSAIVTAFLRDFEVQSDSRSLPDDLIENISQEIYTWLIEIESDIDMFEVNGRIVWQLLYNTDLNVALKLNDIQNDDNEHFDKESTKLTSMIDIQKDVVQEVLAIAKSKELLNTAVLNGRQISRSIRIYQVSVSGSINDVTFQCSCQSADESILKISPSCTSVYLDGSEVRGSQNATILIKYGSFIGYGTFTVWMPLLPLDVRVSDTKLSQIADWKVPHTHRRNIYSFNEFDKNYRLDFFKKELIMDENEDYWSNVCRLRYQHAKVEIYTRFLSTDQNSGREASLLNRRYSVRITHIIQNLIKVSNSKILRVRGNIVEGVGQGTADIEIISPLTGSVIGSKEIQVANDKVTVTHIDVKQVSGIDLNVEHYPTNTNNIWTVKTILLSKLTKQYQEALLSIKVHFSDQTSVYLAEISSNNYKLIVDTFNGVVANVPHTATVSLQGMANDNYLPRIIALSPGKGELVHLSLNPPNSCQREPLKLSSLAACYAFVDVDFPPNESSYQNDAFNFRRFANNHNHSRSDRFSNKLSGSMKLRKRLGYKNYQPTENDQIKYQRHIVTEPKETEQEVSFQFGIYSLLMIVSVASIIIIIFYTAFSIRHGSVASLQPSTCITVDTQTKGPHTTLNPLMRYINNQFGVATSLINDEEWIWIGKEELENRTLSNAHQAQSQNITRNPPVANRELMKNIPIPMKSIRAKTRHVPIPEKRDSSSSLPSACVASSSSPSSSSSSSSSSSASSKQSLTTLKEQIFLPPVPLHRTPLQSTKNKMKRVSNLIDTENARKSARTPQLAPPSSSSSSSPSSSTPPPIPFHRNIKQTSRTENVNKLETIKEKLTPIRPKHLMLNKRYTSRRDNTFDRYSEDMSSIDPTRMHLIDHLKESDA